VNGFEIDIPWPGKSKPRPRVTSKGTYNPTEYTEWKRDIAELLSLMPEVVGLQGEVGLVIKFHPDKISVLASQVQIKRFGQNDLDNLVGGLMDALQEAGVYKNDRQVTAIQAQFEKEE